MGVEPIEGPVEEAEEALAENEDEAVEKTVAAENFDAEARLDVGENAGMEAEATDLACEYAKSSSSSL